MNKGGQVDTLILDFEKAFDTSSHELLKSKLFCYCIGGKTLKWIDSFLCYRKQRVVVNGETPGWAPVLCSVPQGLFADDCVCYREIREADDSLKLQRAIDRLGCWARKLGIRFQPVKCNIMQITRKRTNKTEAYYTLQGMVSKMWIPLNTLAWPSHMT